MELATKLKEYEEKLSDIKLAKSGDKDAFVKIIESNRPTMFRVAISILSNHHDVEDAIQASIIKAYESIGKLKKEEYFKTWFIRILINQCKDILSKNKKIISLEEVKIEEAFNYEINNLELTHAVSKLEDDLRLVTTLFYFEDLAQKDIAKILSIPEGTVRSRLSRSRKKLYELLKE